MAKKTPKLKLTELEQKLVRGVLAQLRLAGIAWQNAQNEYNDEVGRIAGAGYTLEEKEDGIHRKKLEKQD
jgi:hypothetical protein